MCGICGIIKFDSLPVEETSIRKMMQIMKHRGPDDEGVYVEDQVGLGFVRLSIIDLSSAGHQPMVSADGRYVVVFNGEIYNYIEIREELKKKNYVFRTATDTEVLLNAYIEWGEKCLDKFNGMWAFVIYDRQEKTIFGARDRFGIKPFYYIQLNDFFAFASEIQPLLTLLDKKPEPNYQSIFDYLIFNRTDHNVDTFFSKVKRLQHGSKIKIENNQFRETSWYNLRESISNVNGFENPQEFRDLFSSAIKLRLRSDVPVGVCLSGGLDSSSIVSVLLNDYKKSDIKTFSAIYNEGQIGNESKFINEYRPLVQNMYFTVPDEFSLEKDLDKFIRAHGEPLPSTGPYAQFKVMELAKDHIVVSLDGQGADEELAGYHYFYGYFFKELFFKAQFGKLTREIYNYLSLHHSLFAIKSFLFFMLPLQLRTQTRIAQRGYLFNDFANSYKDTNEITKNLYGSKSLNEALIHHFEYKLEHLLKWEDRNSMWFSIEARVPFLDYRLVEKILASSPLMKINKGVTKSILRDAMKGTLPENIRTRRDKIGFSTPQDEWFRTTTWQKIILEILHSDSFKRRRMIDPEKALSQYNSHLSGKINISKDIWKWIHLEMWFRTYID